MNTLVHQQFKSLERYIYPNGFAIPMELNSVNDESEYTIDDRKYYSQTFQIKVMTYIIRKDDYVVTKVQSRVRMPFVSGVNSSRTKCNNKFELDFLSSPLTKTEVKECESVSEIIPKPEPTKEEIMTQPTGKVELEIEELTGKQVCWEDTEDELYVNKKVVYNATIDYCEVRENEGEFQFQVDYNLSLETIELKNISSYRFFINDAEINIEGSDVNMLKGDIVKVIVSIKNEKELAYFTMVTYDVDTILENNYENRQPETIDVNIEEN